MTSHIPLNNEKVEGSDADRELEKHADPESGALLPLGGVEEAEVVQEHYARSNAEDQAEEDKTPAVGRISGVECYADEGDVEEEPEDEAGEFEGGGGGGEGVVEFVGHCCCPVLGLVEERD